MHMNMVVTWQVLVVMGMLFLTGAMDMEMAVGVAMFMGVDQVSMPVRMGMRVGVFMGVL